MHPAFSVLIFTVTSGAGYGLLTIVVLAHLMGLEGVAEQSGVLSGSVILSLVLITAGLLSSTQHLSNPKNAWRAFSRFRTSWLSREAVFAVLLYPFALVYLVGVWGDADTASSSVCIAGVASAALAMATLFCTSMIYASLKTIRQWNTALTPVNYLLLGVMSGMLCLGAVQVIVLGELTGLIQSAVLSLVVIAACAKVIYLYWIGKPAGSTINTATGFSKASVRLLDVGHTADSFLDKEFGFQVAADRLLLLRMVMLAAAFALPFIIVSLSSGYLVVLAALLALSGLLLERWLFFAEARHVVRLYHGEQRT